MITAVAPASTALAIFSKKKQVPPLDQGDITGEVGEVGIRAAGVRRAVGLADRQRHDVAVDPLHHA
jgi:hypothetical protein